MNEVEEFYLQHFGVKGMKWGVRKNRNSSKSANKQAKKTNKALYKEAKGDVKSWSRAKGQRDKNLARNVDNNINRKRANKKGYDQAYGKAKKSYNRKVLAETLAPIVGLTLLIANESYPGAMRAGKSVVKGVLGDATSTAGMYAKYAAKAAVPVSRTVKNRGYIDAILVNSGNAVGFAR